MKQTVREVKEQLAELDDDLVIEWVVGTKTADTYPEKITSIETEFDFNTVTIRLD